MSQSTLPVEFLFSFTLQITSPRTIAGGPQGSRTIVGITGGSFEGPRLRGTVDGVGGDWLTVRPDGSAKLDVRTTLLTDDNAVIFMSYSGILLRRDGGTVIRSAPLFETGDERYAWLNTIQAVGISRPAQPGSVIYDVYALE